MMSRKFKKLCNAVHLSGKEFLFACPPFKEKYPYPKYKALQPKPPVNKTLQPFDNFIINKALIVI